MPVVPRTLAAATMVAVTMLIAACQPAGLPTVPVAGSPPGLASPPTLTSEPDGSVPPLPVPPSQPATSAPPAVSAPTPSAPPPTPAMSGSAAEQLALIRASQPRNTAPDTQVNRDTPQSEIAFEDYLGPWSEHVANYEGSVPFQGIGTSRLYCEFSHFAYDDPLVHPGKPGAAHLHAFFGNSDTNAFTTADSLRNSGGSTCNGFVRNSYWVPALLDDRGNARIPESLSVYYKGYGENLAAIQPYPETMAIVSDNAINLTEGIDGDSIATFQCVSASAVIRTSAETIPECVGQADRYAELIEFNMKFDNCWNGQDPTNWKDNLSSTLNSWYSGVCPDTHPIQLTNLEYRIRYRLAPGETTNGWYLSSDVDPMTDQVRADRGGSAHADWWGAWDPRVDTMWLNNCVRVALDCANGALTAVTPATTGDAGVTALKRRNDYTGDIEVPATRLFSQLCRADRTASTPQQASYCDPAAGMAAMGH